MSAAELLFTEPPPAPEPPPRPAFAPFTGLPSHPALLTLRARRQFVPWTYRLTGGDLSTRTGEVRPFKWAKVPLDVRSGRGASVADPETWTDYETAAAYATAEGCPGVGYVMTVDDGFAGGDLDGVRDPSTGSLATWATELIVLGESYAEVSPSGRGVRLFGLGKPSRASAFAPAGAEVYGTGRWLSLTGRHIAGTPTDIRPAPETFRRLEERVAEARARARAEVEEQRRAAGEEPPRPRRQRVEGEVVTFWQAVDDAAMADFGAWVPALFLGLATRTPGSGYRVTSDALARDLEEDLSIHPSGIRDWGVADMGDAREGKRTPIGLVKEWLYAFGHVDREDVQPKDAAFWLCERLALKPEALGWNARRPASEFFEAEAVRDSDCDGGESGADGEPGKADDGLGFGLRFGLRDGSNEPVISEDEAGIRFAEEYRGKLRYSKAHGKWFVWDGTIWRENSTDLAFHYARVLIRKMAEDHPEKVRIGAGRAAFSGAVERFARADPTFAVTAGAWDQDPWLLGTPRGTVDLRTGELRPARPEDGITRSTAVAPADTADCPLWLRLLDETFAGDAATVRFFQQWAGYSLTGDTREQSLVFGHGEGGNGKGVTINTIGRIAGTYTVTAAAETFVASFGSRHSTELAMLAGARIVKASEMEKGQVWAEKRIKEITGGDEITARFMRQDNFTFLPTFKLIIIGNDIPDLNQVDDAMRRRFNLLPFLHKPSRPDPGLIQKLEEEWPAILRWMIDGCLDWRRNGLLRPECVLAATREYFSDQDTMAHWAAESCTIDRDNDDLREATARLYASWSSYARGAGVGTGSEKAFARDLRTRFRLRPREKIPLPSGSRVRGFSGIALRAASFHEVA